MKLIEKLADDYYQDRPEGFGDPREDFMAGFRKACEFAAAQFRTEPESEWEGEYVARKLASLGEEET